jgi:transposase
MQCRPFGGLALVSWRHRYEEVTAVEGRKFDREFRGGAVRIVRETGKPIAQVARELGLNEGTLGRWVNQDRRARAGDGALSESERDELTRLRRENAELAMDRCPQALGGTLVREAMGR